jgi:hypothetical protein
VNSPHPNSPGDDAFAVILAAGVAHVTFNPYLLDGGMPAARPSLFKPKHGIVRPTDSLRLIARNT